MKVIIPDNFFEVPLGQPVYVWDLEWNRETKGWTHVIHYGDYQKKCKRRYIIRHKNETDNIRLLHLYLRYFPGTPFTTDRYSEFRHNKGALIAYILFLTGAESVNHHFKSKEDLSRIRVSRNSIYVKPYLTHPVCSDNFSTERPLLWYLLGKVKNLYSGGASFKNDKNSYAQASYSFKNEKESLLYSDIVIYFNAFKDNEKGN